MKTPKSIIKGMLRRYRHRYFSNLGNKTKEDFSNLPLNTPDKVSAKISQLLERDEPAMISRFGSTELTAALYYGRDSHPLGFLRRIVPFWIPKDVGSNMSNFSGFFPNERKLLADFSDRLFADAREVDLLGSWFGMERIIENRMGYQRCPLLYLEPYWSSLPWTRSLKGKKVLVVHPFAETVKEQYAKRTLLFVNPDILPDFELKVIKAVQSLGGNNNGYQTWFDALKDMENQIDAIDYDVALIGCGAYGMPLAAHCKRMGKKAVHLGGALQLLFGIKGNRWEEDGYGSDFGFNYKPLISNPNWVRPVASETPANSLQVEGACYW